MAMTDSAAVARLVEQSGSAGSELVLVLCTFPNPDDLGEIFTLLLREDLIACANILRECHSVYKWRGEIVSNKEVLCLLKTQRACLEALAARMTELHPYEVPELVVLSPSAVNEAYLAWVREETAPPQP
ncbi:MAG: divalent-cation tolerance protein CutA [Polyangia bacterium]